MDKTQSCFTVSELAYNTPNLQVLNLFGRFYRKKSLIEKRLQRKKLQRKKYYRTKVVWIDR